MAKRFEREPRLQDNYTQVPHGLWTAPVSYGAKILLGWLHSHSPSYLARLSNNRIRAELGCSGQVTQWIDELVQAGFIRVEKAGQANRFILLARSWEALAHRECNRPENGHHEELDREPDEYRSVTDRIPAGNQPENGHIEEQVVDQGGNHSSVGSSEIEQATIVEVVPEWEVQFEQFWRMYLRKDSRKDAVAAFKRMKNEDRRAALERLPDHVAMWQAEKRERKHIPLPATWLNGERWKDVLTGDYEPPKSLVQKAIEFANEWNRQEREHEDRGSDSGDWDAGRDDHGLERRGRAALCRGTGPVGGFLSIDEGLSEDIDLMD
jgi:hypothetical protein